MAILGKFEVTIRVNEREMTEYNDDDDNQHEANVDSNRDQDRTITRFVEAQGGQPFSIRVRVDPNYKLTREADSLAVNYFADGERISSSLLERATSLMPGYPFRDIDCIRYRTGSLWKQRDLLFKNLENTCDAIDGRDLKAYSARGTLKIQIIPFLQTGISEDHHDQPVEKLQLAEKATKGRAVNLAVGFGVERPGTARESCHGKYLRPRTTFVFEYRSKESLKQLMLIPRTPSPEPEISLADRDPATLTQEEMRQLIMEMKASQRVKPEAIKPESGIKEESGNKRRAAVTPVDEDELQFVSTKKVRSSDPSDAIIIN